MIVNSIQFKNYKAFSNQQTLKLKPITILIGKNSSGKSAVAKLFPLLENSLSGKILEPLRYSNDNVVLGADFRDLVFNQLPSSPISFATNFGDSQTVNVSILKEKETSPNLVVYSWAFNEHVFNLNSEGRYQGTNGDVYNIEFNGFIPQKIVNNNGDNILNQIGFKRPSIDVDYIGPFRILPERAFVLTGQSTYEKVGVKGENAYSMLAISKKAEGALHKSVGEWYQKHFDGWYLDVLEKAPFNEIVLKKDEKIVNIVDVGQGMNQALPLVTRANFGKPNTIVVLEQPELHLHPAAHGDLAELFAVSAKKLNQTFLIETHSENFLLRLRRLIVENDFPLQHDDVLIYWVTEDAQGGQRLDEITINSDGILSDWPDGVFSENLVEIAEMRKALKRRI